MKYRESDCPFMQRSIAEFEPGVAKLTADQFALWWRSLTDDERHRYNTAALVDDPVEYINELYWKQKEERNAK